MSDKPDFYQEMLTLEWNREDHTPEEQWAIAQKWEAEFWLWRVKEKEGCSTRKQFVEHQTGLGRYMVHSFNLNGALAGKVLDVGCGVTSVLEGWPSVDVVAIDPLLAEYHAKMPEIALLGRVGNCDYRSCLLEHVLEEDFDIAWSYNVIDHTPDWRGIIEHMYRVLKPGGLLLLAVDVAEERFGSQARRMMHPSIIRHKDLLDCIEGAEFDIEWYGVPEANAVRTRVPVVAWK